MTSIPEPAPKYRRVDNLGRQVWDKEYFEAKALARQYEGGADPGVDFLFGKDQAAAVAPTLQRKSLEQRKKAIHLEEDLGKMRVITAATPREQQGGFWCKVCSCLMKDSQTYLDHINGKKHNRMLGMTMRVAKVEASSIREKLKSARLEHAKQIERKALEGLDGIELRLADAKEKEELKKLKKAERKKKKKKQKEEEAEPFLNPFEILAQLAEKNQLSEIKSEHQLESLLNVKSEIPPASNEESGTVNPVLAASSNDPADIADVSEKSLQSGVGKENVSTIVEQLSHPQLATRRLKTRFDRRFA